MTFCGLLGSEVNVARHPPNATTAIIRMVCFMPPPYHLKPKLQSMGVCREKPRPFLILRVVLDLTFRQRHAELGNLDLGEVGVVLEEKILQLREPCQGTYIGEVVEI